MKKTTEKKQTKKTGNTSVSKAKRVSGDDELPGYPKYPAKEDIMSRGDRVSMDEDGTALPNSPESKKLHPSHANSNKSKTPKNPANVTKEDLKVLKNEGKEEEGDDKELKDRVYPVDFAGDDLDVPGRELDDKGELTGNEDEENNLYSIGGENHEDLEEDRSAI